MKNEDLTIILMIAFVSLFGIGWIANIVKLATGESGIDGMDLVRVAGIIIAPLGAILGIF